MGIALNYSSITKKIIMSLAGLFLISFLLVHLGINLLILLDDTYEKFNVAAHFMATNPLIQTFQWVLFIGFILHILYGVILQIQNWSARPIRYNRKGYSELSYFSKFMIHTGVIVFIFLILHFANFFVVAKFGHLEEVSYRSGTYENMGAVVIEVFKIGWYVAFYVLSILLLGFHLDHGFQSAFQSLGINHWKYTPLLKKIGTLFSILVTLGFASIPLVIYFS